MIYINMSINGYVDPAVLSSFLAGVSEAPPHSENSAPVVAADKPLVSQWVEKPKDEPQAEPAAKEEQKRDGVTHEQVVAAAQALVNKNGREALAELLGEFNAKNLSGIAKGDRAAFIDRCEG